MIFRHGVLSRRDAFLLLIGASSMHIWSLLFAAPPALLQSDIVINTHVSQPAAAPAAALATLTTTEVVERTRTQTRTETQVQLSTKTETHLAQPTPQTLSPHAPLPPTELLAHAPGWTLFRNLYMSNGTLFIVADENQAKLFPDIRMMTSTGLTALNTPENIAAREPTAREMQIVGVKEAREMWTQEAKEGRVNRVWTVEGNTVLFNDPPQFLRHYYHLVAELFLGVQAFWHGAFSPPLPSSSLSSASASNPLVDPEAAVHYSTQHPQAPPIHRAIFAHSNADGWRDSPGFNAYFLRAAFPSLVVEHEEDWRDRVLATSPSSSSTQPSSPQTSHGERAWHFPLLLLVDRSAAFKGEQCGSKTQRTAAEAYEYMRVRGKLRGVHVGGWWADVREAVWRFAGVQRSASNSKEGTTPRANEPQEPQMHFGSPNPEVRGLTGPPPPNDPANAVAPSPSSQSKLPKPEKVVITYISRQSARNRKLISGDHERLVEELEGLVRRRNAERRDFLAGVEERVKREGKKGEGKEERGVDGKEGGNGKREEEPLEWELAVLEAEKLSKDEQVRQAARTTIMLGVHGNGLTHLVFMPPTRAATVIELFFPGGFAHDYQWTARALGMSHFAVWNDTYHTFPNEPPVDYPEGFQLNEIPVHAPTIAQIIEDRVAGKI